LKFDQIPIVVIVVNESVQLATLSLSTAQVSVLLRGPTMGITGRLGSMALSDDSGLQTAAPEFKEIMAIEGDNFAEFRYQTYDPDDIDEKTGVNSQVWFKAASVKVHFLEKPLHDIYLFVVKLANLKGLYDAAAQAAVQRASEIQRMQFDVSVKSPIVVFPADAGKSRDTLVMRLGEIGAKNHYEGQQNRMAASLSGIQLVSRMHCDDSEAILKMIDDIDITADIIQTTGIDRNTQLDQPDTQVRKLRSSLAIPLTCASGCSENI
jgi:vacuolar protein sorting-associated protein 13A/C